MRTEATQEPVAWPGLHATEDTLVRNPAVDVEACVSLNQEAPRREANHPVQHEATGPLEEDHITKLDALYGAGLDMHHGAMANPWPHAEPKGANLDGATALKRLTEHVEAELSRLRDLSHKS